MTAIDQKADEYAYNEWRDFPEEQAIARRGFKAGAEHVLKLYESGTSEKEQLIAELEKENKQLRADYDKQKEINIELVDDMAELHIRIRELETQLKRVTEAQDLPF